MSKPLLSIWDCGCSRCMENAGSVLSENLICHCGHFDSQFLVAKQDGKRVLQCSAKAPVTVQQVQRSFTVEELIEWFLRYRAMATADNLDAIGDVDFEQEFFNFLLYLKNNNLPDAQK